MSSQHPSIDNVIENDDLASLCSIIENDTGFPDLSKMTDGVIHTTIEPDGTPTPSHDSDTPPMEFQQSLEPGDHDNNTAVVNTSELFERKKNNWNMIRQITAVRKKSVDKESDNRIISQRAIQDISALRARGDLDANSAEIIRGVVDFEHYEKRKNFANHLYERADQMELASRHNNTNNNASSRSAGSKPRNDMGGGDNGKNKSSKDGNKVASSKTKYKKRKDAAREGGGTSEIAKHEEKISNRVPRDIESTTVTTTIDAEMVPPLAKKARLNTFLPADSQASHSTSGIIGSAGDVVISHSDKIQPLHLYMGGGLPSEKILTRHSSDPVLGILHDLASFPLSTDNNNNNKNTGNSNKPKVAADSAPSKRGEVDGNLNLKSGSTVKGGRLNKNNTNKNADSSLPTNDTKHNATTGNIVNVDALAQDNIFDHFVKQNTTAKKKQSESMSGLTQSWQKQTKMQQLPRTIRETLMNPFSGDLGGNEPEYLKNIADRIVKGHYDAHVAEEVKNMAANISPITKTSQFSIQLQEDFKRLFSYDTLYNDPSISDHTKQRLREKNVRGTIANSTYSVGVDMKNGKHLTARIDPEKDKKKSEELYGQCLLTLNEGSIVFSELLAEETERAKRLEDCYTNRTNVTFIANKGVNDDKDSYSCPTVHREHILLFMREPTPEMKSTMRPCKYNESCQCKAMAGTYKGLLHASNRPSHGVLSGTAPFSMSIGRKPSIEHGRQLEATTQNGLFVSHGFINVEFLLPDEWIHYNATGELPDRAPQACVICHIAEVNQAYHDITAERTTLLSKNRNGVIKPVNRFQVYVDTANEYDSSMCLPMSHGRGPTAVIGHFPIYSTDNYQYSTYKTTVSDRIMNSGAVSPTTTSGHTRFDIGDNSNNNAIPTGHVTTKEMTIELQCILECGMDFHQS